MICISGRSLAAHLCHDVAMDVKRLNRARGEVEGVYILLLRFHDILEGGKRLSRIRVQRSSCDVVFEGSCCF